MGSPDAGAACSRYRAGVSETAKRKTQVSAMATRIKKKMPLIVCFEYLARIGSR